jgi:hypothetical protein
MSLEHAFFVSQIIASAAIVASLIFVGLQVKDNTTALQRNEHNSTMAQWTVIRMAIARNRDIAELMTDGLRGSRPLDAADQLRLDQMLQENAWASFHIWDRTRRGVFPRGTFELTGGALLCGLLKTERGGSWWRSAKHTGFVPEFVVDVDAMLVKDNQGCGVSAQASPSAPAGESASGLPER